MLLLGKEIEDKLNSFKMEILGRIENGPVRDITDNVKKLATASSACSDKISRVTKISSENGAAIAGVSACQTKQDIKFEALDSAIIKMKQDLEIIQARNEHIVSNQAENNKKVASVESTQTKLMGMVSSAEKVSITVQKHLETLGDNLTPKTNDAAAGCMTVSYTHLRAHET